MSVSSRLKATQIIGQINTFFTQRIPESSCERKETIDIDTLVISRSGDRKTMHHQNNEQTSLENKEVETVQAVQMNIYQSNDLSWLNFDDEARVQHRQQGKDQQSCISIFEAHLIFHVATRSTSPDMTTVFHLFSDPEVQLKQLGAQAQT